MSAAADYLASLVQHFVFFSSDVQTTTLAIAITGSLCCSIVWLVVNLLSGTGWHPQGRGVQPSNLREVTPPPHQGLGVLSRKTGGSGGVVTFHLNHRKHHSISSSSSGNHGNILSSSSSQSSNGRKHSWGNGSAPLWACNKSDNSHVMPCMRCGLRAADQLCQLIHCSSCCHNNIADTCDYHGGSPQAAKGLIEGACHYKPTEIDLSYLNLQLCPERVGYIGAQLVTLNLSNNRLSVLPDELGCLLGLQELFLQYNCLTTLPISIGNLTRLQELDLKNNSLCSLPASIGNLSQLRSLKLMNNQLLSLPASVGGLSQLEELSANANQLTVLPDETCKLSKLMVLYLGDNKLQQLPDELGRLIRLTELDVAGCELSLLPDSICRCAALVRLWLSNNRLRRLPAKIGHLHHLKELHIKSNNLRVLPASLASLHLYTFTASHNPLLEETDEVCASLSRCPVHPIPSLHELAACNVISARVKWKQEGLPQVLQDMLERAQSCDCCDAPVFETYHSCLVFASIGLHRVPLYQQICTARHSQHCRFITV